MKYTRILVPLDFSDLAARVLPLAGLVAERGGAAVTIATVIPPSGKLKANPVSGGSTTETPEAPPAEIPVERSNEFAQEQLERIAQQLRGRGIHDINCLVASGEPASVILDMVHGEKADLIAMATRGRSGLVRGLLGSVTDRVIHGASTPVLVVRPGNAPAAEGESAGISDIIVPLDGSDLAETALPHAEALAEALDAALMFIRVERSSSTEHEARAYLSSMVNARRESGRRVESRVAVGDPRTQIVELAGELQRSMVVMTTKGEAGFTRWRRGSVSDGVLRTAPVPTMIIPPATQAA